MCIDFTRLNKACPKDNFPLPRISILVDVAAGCEMLSLLDCFSGYHQIWMNKDDEEKTSFTTPFGTYYFRRMPEGLHNAGSTFARMTTEVFKDDKAISAYIDDIMVQSKLKKDHIADLTQTFMYLWNAKLKLNPDKLVVHICCACYFTHKLEIAVDKLLWTNFVCKCSTRVHAFYFVLTFFYRWVKGTWVEYTLSNNQGHMWGFAISSQWSWYYSYGSKAGKYNGIYPRNGAKNYRFWCSKASWKQLHYRRPFWFQVTHTPEKPFELLIFLLLRFLENTSTLTFSSYSCRGYCALEYMTIVKPTLECDIYSLGIVIKEIVTGRIKTV